MRQGLLVGFVVAMAAGSGALAFTLPQILPSLSDGSGIAFDCEDLIEGDRVEIRDEAEGQRFEIRVEADTRVRAEVRIEDAVGSEMRREAKLDLCGIVEFVDEDADGQLTAADTIVRSDLVEFGVIAHRLTMTVHVFETGSDQGNMSMTIRIPSVSPPAEEPLIDWMVVASPECDPAATHFAVKLEQEVPVDSDTFFAAPCGTTLTASGDTATSPPAPGTFECQALSEGTEFATFLTERNGDIERTLEARVSANTRVRAEARFDNVSMETQVRQEARLDLCGIVEFVDEDGDREFGSADTVISAALVEFDAVGHRLEGGFHSFEATNVSANLTIAIRLPATFPGADESLLRWSVEASPACQEGATHFAVKLELEGPTAMDRFLVAECGAILSVAGEAG